MTVFCGIDWADDHHDIALIDHTGSVILQQRINDNAEGWALRLGLRYDRTQPILRPLLTLACVLINLRRPVQKEF